VAQSYQQKIGALRGLVPQFVFKKLQQQQQQQLHGHSIGKMVIKCDQQILIVGFNPSEIYYGKSNSCLKPPTR
jgi:hypothetical protein